MKTRMDQILRAIPMVAGLLASVAFAQPEAEPNDSLGQANGPFAVGATITGAISQSESDFFAIDLQATSSLMLAVWGPQSGVCPNMFDPVLRIYDPSGTLLAVSDDVGASFCPRLDPTSAPALANLAPGVYYLQVTCFTAVPGQTYQLLTSTYVEPAPVTEKFTYQGELKSGGVAVNGYKQMKFSLWADQFDHSVGARVGLPLVQPYVEIVDGKFTVDLEFPLPGGGSSLDGNERFLEIEISEENGSNAVVLEPRQRVAPAPYAIRSLSATSAQSAMTATQAQSATHADWADSAMSASFANGVFWESISSMPSGFADDVDDEGGWQDGADVTFTAKRVGINTGTPSTFNLAVNGTAAKPGGGSWAVFSDERLKHDITPMRGTLDRLMQLRGYSYEYNKDAVEHRLAMPGRQIGLLAQEVERVFPDWVQMDDQGYRYVTERATTALMVEALRDLRSEKDEQLKSLQTENQELRARLERLESLLKQPR